MRSNDKSSNAAVEPDAATESPQLNSLLHENEDWYGCITTLKFTQNPILETHPMNSNENRPSDTREGEPADAPKRGEFFGYQVDESPAGGTTYTYWRTETPDGFIYAHDTADGLFIVTRPDGTVERFRDNAARYLVVEPDPQSGQIRPAVKNDQFVYLYLCREHREG